MSGVSPADPEHVVTRDRRSPTLQIPHDASPSLDGLDWEPAIGDPRAALVERLVRRRYTDPYQQNGLIRLATERFEDRGEVLDFLALRPGDRVLDLGCGVGWFSIPMAEEVGPAGRVHALELRKEPLEVLEDQLDHYGPARAGRVYMTLNTPADTGLKPRSVDVAFFAHLGFLLRSPLDFDTAALLTDVRRTLRTDGRLVVVQWMGGHEGDDPMTLILNIEDAGFELHDWRHDTLNNTWMLEFLEADAHRTHTQASPMPKLSSVAD